MKRGHEPPSRRRYDEAHPVVSFRVSREDYALLKETLAKNEKSIGQFFREALGKERKSTDAALSESYSEGYGQGYSEACEERDYQIGELNAALSGASGRERKAAENLSCYQNEVARLSGEVARLNQQNAGLMSTIGSMQCEIDIWRTIDSLRDKITVKAKDPHPLEGTSPAAMSADTMQKTTETAPPEQTNATSVMMSFVRESVMEQMLYEKKLYKKKQEDERKKAAAKTAVIIRMEA